MKKYTIEWDCFSHDFKNGVRVRDEVVQGWVDEIIPYLIGSPSGTYRHIRSGNSVAIGFRSDEDVTVFIVKDGYKEMTLSPALGARSGAKQSPRSGTERQRATKRTGRKAATPKSKKK